ncbi:MAG: leucyl aminopeptidase [Nannocystaceae bacterium]
MTITLTLSPGPALEIQADAAAVIFRPGEGLGELTERLSQNAQKWVSADRHAFTWVEAKKATTPRVVLAGAGAAGEAPTSGARPGAAAAAERHSLRLLGASLERALNKAKLARVILTSASPIDLAPVIEGMILRSYRSTEWRRKPDPQTLREVVIVPAGGGEVPGLQARLAEAQILAEAQNYARELADLPGNHGGPAAVVVRAREAAAPVGLIVDVLGDSDAAELGMGLFLGVNQGAAQPGRILILEHRGAESPTLVLVGKGVTHDTGGYNLKSSSTLHDMTYDKCGATAVIGAMQAIARLALPARVIAVCPLVENCVDAEAFKPGDILRAMDGTTVFIDNTDAEGRLILADCLTYVRRYKPDAVIDIATLTGACATALGEHYAGLFTNSDELRDLLIEAGEASGDLVWPLPIHPAHVRALQHHKADLKNTGPRAGGASTAAAFLRHFTDYPWAHLDMAGSGHTSTGRDYYGKGATGYGVRLLVAAIRRLCAPEAAAGDEAERGKTKRRKQSG